MIRVINIKTPQSICPPPIQWFKLVNKITQSGTNIFIGENPCTGQIFFKGNIQWDDYNSGALIGGSINAPLIPTNMRPDRDVYLTITMRDFLNNNPISDYPAYFGYIKIQPDGQYSFNFNEQWLVNEFPGTTLPYSPTIHFDGLNYFKTL